MHCPGGSDQRGPIASDATELRDQSAPGRDHVRGWIDGFAPWPSVDDAHRDLAPTVVDISPEVRASIVAWQKTDRAYALVQGVARGAVDRARLDPGGRLIVERITDHLDAAIVERPLPRDVRVYRGVRSLEATFGTDDTARILGVERVWEGFSAVSVDRAVAVDEFTGPTGALIELDLPAGTPALWVAGTGNPALARQGELLLGRGLRVRVIGIGQEADRPVALVRVIQ